MSFSNDDLSPDELALFAADKPILGANTIPDIAYIGTYKWTIAGGGGTDKTDTSYPAYRAFDGLCNLDTRADSAQTSWYYEITFNVGIEIDFCAINGHNFGSIGSLTACQVQIANDAAFSANLTTIADFGTPTTNGRLVDWSLSAGTAQRYSNVQCVRLKLTKGSSFTPQLRELILGRRRQLKTNPLVPYDPTSLHSNAPLIETAGGILYRTTFRKGRYHLNATLGTHETAYQDDLANFFEETQWGTCPFVWCPQPTSYPNNWYWMMLEEPDFDFPIEDYTERKWAFSAFEQGPQSYYLNVENV